MSQIGPGPNPYGPQPGQAPGYPQPVVYRPGVPMGGAPMAPGAYGAPDQYRPGMPPRAPMGPNGQPMAQEPPYEYVASKDVAFGIAGAVGGYFLAGLVGLSGPVGAIILGIALLGISAIVRAVNHSSQKKKQEEAAQQGMPKPPTYPTPAQPMYQNRYNYENQQQPGQQDPRYRYPQ
ncbi:MAG: hypothetical protein ACAI44_33655 [Candidatus Sericytochromatia bacterium]